MATTTYVVATVAVEVEVGPWGDDAVVRDLVKTATREAGEKVQAVLGRSGIRVSGVTSIRVVMASMESKS